MITCPLGDYIRWQESQETKYQSFFGTTTLREAKLHLRGWIFDGPVELSEAIHRAWYNGETEDHKALCAVMQSGEWRCL